MEMEWPAVELQPLDHKSNTLMPNHYTTTPHLQSLIFVKELPLFLLFSFYAPDFPSNISYLFNALQHISSWMTANLPTLNTSKTEFLLIGLKQQLAKIQNCTLNTTHSARNLGFIFDEHLTFSDQISALSKSCYSLVNFAVSPPILISKQPIPLLPPLSTLNLTTVTHYTTTYLILS